MERGLGDLMTPDLTDGKPSLRKLSKYMCYAFLSFNMLLENPVKEEAREAKNYPDLMGESSSTLEVRSLTSGGYLLG